MQKLNLNHYGVDESPKDDTEIVSQALLYYSKEEIAEFKSLCKIGIKKMYGDEAIANGNVSDFILKLLRITYNGKIHIEKEVDGQASGRTEDDVPPI
jgi:hypothetical protein